jgi:signal transduction histidine kinase
MSASTLEGRGAARLGGAKALAPAGLLRRLAASGRDAHPLLLDLLGSIAIAIAAIAQLDAQHRLDLHQALFTALLSSVLLARRRHPLITFGVLAATAFVQWATADPQLGDAALLVALYEVAMRGSVAEVALAGATMEAGAVMAAVKWSPSDPVKVWVGLSGLVVAAAVLGITIRQRRALLLSLQERAARLELERDQEGRLAAAAERNRIAREMHDIVAHNLSVMIALADGASFAIDRSPERSAQATRQVSATGRDALLEMRRLLGILGDEQPSNPLAPQPGLAELERLVERVRIAGVPVTLDVQGDPLALPEGVQLTVFRVAQEALTNTLKHASRPTGVRLSLRCEPHHVELEALDDGQPPAAAARHGRGLRGMRERALAYGGELQAGPLPSGGWRVHMTLSPSRGGS